MIAIIPAGGKAVRFDGLPKFMLPAPSGGTLMSVLLDRMTAAAPRKIVIAATNGNKRVLRPYADRATIFDAITPTMTHAVMLARDDLHMDENTLMGMPDTFFDGDDVFQKLALRVNYADVVVAVWRCRENQQGQGGQCLVVESDEGWHIEHVVDKDPDCDYGYIWGALAWRPVFWDFLDASMPHVGYGLQPAIDAGLDVRAVVMNGDYYDCGTAERYFECVRANTSEKVGE